MAHRARFHILLMLFAMLLAAGLSYALLRQASAPMPEKNTEIILSDAYFFNDVGEKVTLADFKGKAVLVNLWAVWCPPCVAELPALDKLQARLKDRGFEVVAIALGSSPAAEVEKFLLDRRIEHLDVYLDTDRQIALKWPYSGVPASFLLDASGRVLARFDGPRDWSEEDVAEAFASSSPTVMKP